MQNLPSKTERRLAMVGHQLQASAQPQEGLQSAGSVATDVSVKTRYKPSHEIDTTPKGHSVWFGWRTLYLGQAALVGDRLGLGGNRKLVSGPCVLFLVFQSFELLTPFFANPNQFLRVQFLTGERRTIQGPCSMFLDPSQHASIQIHSAVTLNSGQAIVVYKRQESVPSAVNTSHPLTSEVSRKVVHGPAQYVPEADEWMHKFFWNIPEQSNPTYANRQLLKFEKLRTIPDQIYYDITGCRTSDDALIVIKTLVFFRLRDIELMLKGSADPVADLINTLTADVLDFTASRTFEQFKADSEQLNKLETYKQVRQRLSSIGYDVEKIVYRGYVASNKLQDMHNNAIEARTLLTLGTETEKQQQDLEDLKLRRKQERVSLEQEQESKTVAHKAELENKTAAHKRALAQMEHAEALRKAKADDEQARMRQNSALEHEVFRTRELNKANLEAQIGKEQAEGEMRKTQLQLEAAHLQTLASQGVDLTKYLVAKHAKPDKLISITGNESLKGATTQLHLYDEGLGSHQ